MSSEKSRYLNRYRGPKSLEFTELRKYLPSLGVEALVDHLWFRAQYDDTLLKTLMVSVVICQFPIDWGQIKAAVDYALYFPNHIRYTEHGHGDILNAIEKGVGRIVNLEHVELALHIARYAVERGSLVAENFEDDWDWTSALEDLTQWIKMTETKHTLDRSLFWYDNRATKLLT